MAYQNLMTHQENRALDDVVLITACIAPARVYGLKISDVKERLRDYLGSLLKWIINTDANVLIFCENSNYRYDYSLLVDLSNLFNKTLEILTFDGNRSEIEKYGKGYGEGEIIKYAIFNSKHLVDNVSFYKVTGGIYVENFNLICRVHNRDENIFNKVSLRRKNLVDTKFYKINARFYKEHLLDAYTNVRDREGYYLEHIYYEMLKDKKTINFKIYPRFEGRSRSTGLNLHENNIKFLIKNLLSKFDFYRVS